EALYLCHARLRECRGQTLYAVPSMFLEELPEEGIENIDVPGAAADRLRGFDEWRTGSKAAEQGWADAGVVPKTRAELLESKPVGNVPGFAEGMIVRHESYGQGRVTEVSGYGALRKIKVRFSSAGERTVLADKAKLAVVGR